MPSLSYRSYGKVNLYLDILDRRADGFTNIETVLQSIDLWDRLEVRKATSGIALTCSDPTLGAGPDNLVHRAAALLRKRANIQSGVALHLEKNLPIAAGLAGGSGNAAATLIALNDLWELGWDIRQLRELALELGSDVPFCLVGGTVAATGRGEKMKILPPMSTRWLVLVHPVLAVTAGHAYGHPELTRNRHVPVDGMTLPFRKALKQLDQGRAEDMVFNRMESGIFCDHPELAEIKDHLMTLGCSASAMSGSGPTVFGLCDDKTKARSIAKQITGIRTSVVCTVPYGVLRE
ncbi:MAG: 4-(cytidine 5'-diphospho)-2-C-methyl-D-erythritol kinase [Candidatus Hydrogenedentes bacterium]|nr:4-(cytidine 5'-diphospho)-2-C-methyl-D-erythritol kinase [Candidatus Hydrogenedentota bacterium]